MKKKITALTAAALMALGSAASVCGEDDIKVLLNGSEIEFDVPPMIINDRTMVPMRMIFEAMGAEVEWYGETQSVVAEKGDTVISMTIDNNTMYVGDDEVTLEAAPTIIGDRTLVPARAVAESFGAEVDWDGDTRTVIITYADEEPAAAATPTATPAATAAPTAAPAATAAAADCPIDYSGIATSEVSTFKITEWALNDDGDYEITYTLRTFKEGSGSIEATFNCLDASGKVVDTFGGLFKCTDYTWTNQTETATIPGSTVKIELKQ